MSQVVVLDGENLTIEDLVSIESPDVVVEIPESAWQKVREGRKVVQDILDRGEKVYGINTGFGNFADVSIAPQQLQELQENLIRSHAAGVGEPLTPNRARVLLALRINVLVKGRSGIREENLRKLLDACNKWCLSWVPERGTVGASGDLAPLAHLALGMLGEGKMWDPTKKVWHSPAAEVLKAHGLEPISLTAKEGLALINGTQFISGLGAEALKRAKNISIVADVCGAMSLEALKGTTKAFNPLIHNARPHNGQLTCAARLRSLLHSEKYPSEIAKSHENCGTVQDSYTLRCMPQVHGIGIDTIKFVEGIMTTEINSATDNPMVFAEIDDIISGGNFHGEYPAKACDYLAIGVHEYGNISERRIERLVNHHLSGLPAFLVKEGGLNSGFMIAHCTAAACVSENKQLCHPASVDSISTSAAKEDHVSMGGWSARKSLMVVSNVETVLAIELLAACQGLEFLRPSKSTAPLEAVHSLVRSKVKPWDRDRVMHPDIDAVIELIKTGQIVNAVKPFIDL